MKPREESLSESFKRARAEVEREEIAVMTTLERAESNRGEDVAILIVIWSALMFLGLEVYKVGLSLGVAVAIGCLLLTIFVLIARFRRALHP